MKDKIILLGGGGHAKVLIDLIRSSGELEIAGILDPKLQKSEQVTGVPVLGDEELLPDLFERGIKNACIAVGSIKDIHKRKSLYEKIKSMGFSIPPLVHPSAIVSPEASLSNGVQVMAGAIVQAGSFIGENTIVNTGATVDHDCRIGNHVHICPGVIISGGCVLHDCSFTGAGATIIQSITIGHRSKVSAGATIIQDVSDGTTVKGGAAL